MGRLLLTSPLDRVAFVSALEVPPDAVLVAKANRYLTREQAEAIQAAIQEVLPGRRVLVLPPWCELDVVREAAE